MPLNGLGVGDVEFGHIRKVKLELGVLRGQQADFAAQLAVASCNKYAFHQYVKLVLRSLKNG